MTIGRNVKNKVAQSTNDGNANWYDQYGNHYSDSSRH